MKAKVESEYGQNVIPQRLTEAESKDYLTGVELAHLANVAFDQRAERARDIAAVAGEIEREPSSKQAPRFAGMKEKFSTADSDYKLYSDAASALMPAYDSASSKPAEKVGEENESFASESVWSLMTPEQKTKAGKLRTAIAEQFKDQGLTPADLRVVMGESDEGKRTFTLVHSGNGIDIGNPKKDYDKARSYNAVMDKKNDKVFTVEIDGVKYDVRKGMTSSVYDALYEDSKMREGVSLPDSRQASETFDDLWTWTMLTGESLTADGDVQIRNVGDGRVRGSVDPPDGGARALRVRPAVEV